MRDQITYREQVCVSVPETVASPIDVTSTALPRVYSPSKQTFLFYLTSERSDSESIFRQVRVITSKDFLCFSKNPQSLKVSSHCAKREAELNF